MLSVYGTKGCPTISELVIERCAPGFFRVPIPIPVPLKTVNAYLAEDPDGYTIIDCGFHNDVAERHWIRVFQQLNIRPEQVKRIIVTHFHPDHYGAAGWLHELTGAPVYMFEREIANVRNVWRSSDYEHKFSNFFLSHGVPEEAVAAVIDNQRATLKLVEPQPPRLEPLTEHEPIELGGHTFRLLWTPGHTGGLVVFWSSESRLLLANDMVLSDITPNISLGPAGSSNPLQQYYNSLQKVARLPARLTLTGHRRAIHNLAERCDEIWEHHKERLAATRDIVAGIAHRNDSEPTDIKSRAENGLTAWQVCLELFGTFQHPVQTRFAMTETLAHLEYLVAQGEVDRTTAAPYVYSLP